MGEDKNSIPDQRIIIGGADDVKSIGDGEVPYRVPNQLPEQVKLLEKKYDDFLIRWIAEVSFEMEAHDQPYLVTLVSETGNQWRSNGVRFYSEEEAGKDIESRWLLNEGNHKQLDKVVEKLTQAEFIQHLATVIT